MSLYGALFSGVSGLNAQSNKLGVISDNISNVNTVGYKATAGVFGTLVTSSAGSAAYSPGGVLGTASQLISTQGLLQTTSSPTDIGIQGSGFFVVNQNSDGSGQVEYTRAGSFTADSTGNYRNTSGLYLQAWPLDRDGLLPGEPGNLNTTSSSNLASLETVNVTSLTGSAASTSNVSLSANLTSSQKAFIGAAGVVTMDSLDLNNSTIASKDVIVPSTVNGTARGDAFTVSSGSTNTTYTYGGFTFGRKVDTGDDGDSGVDNLPPPVTISADSSTLFDTATTLASTTSMSVNGSGLVTITMDTTGLKIGDHVTLTNATDFGGVTAATQLNTAAGFTILSLNSTSFTIQTTASGTTNNTTGGGTATVTPTPISVAADGTITVFSHANGLIVGDAVTLSGLTGSVSGLANSTLNDHTFIVASAGTDKYTLTSTLVGNGVAGGAGTIVQADEPIRIQNNSKNIIIRHPDHGLKVGDVVTLSGAVDVGNVTASTLNNSFVVKSIIDDDHYVIASTTTATSDTGGGSTGTLVATTRPFVGNVLDASTDTQSFLGTTGTSAFSTSALSFTITTATSGKVTFTYTASTPNAQAGQFNNLSNLATAINNVNGLSARVVDHRLYVSATDSNEAISFANVQEKGDDTGASVLSGINWTRELGLADIGNGTNRFATLEGLSAIVSGTAGLSGTIQSPISDASLSINTESPSDTIEFKDRAVAQPLAALGANGITTTVGSKTITITLPSAVTYAVGDVVTLSGTGLTADGSGNVNGIPKADYSGHFTILSKSGSTFTVQLSAAATVNGTATAGLVVTPPTNSGSLVAALGLVASLNNIAYTDVSKGPQDTGAIQASYDSTDPERNMASGSIAPHSTRPATIFDAQGTGHNINMSFLKTAANTWAVEVYVVPSTDVSSTGKPNGQIATGTLTFNGDGTLRSVVGDISSSQTVQWTNGAAPSTLSFNWGTAGQPSGTPNATVIGLADGMSQQSADYSLNFVKQNGAPVGQLTGVAIDREGYITASYSNGETQKLFKIPLASFANPDSLQSVSGNAYTQTSDSGEVNLKQADTSGVGFLSSSSLEASNVELANQLTDMIVAQRAYQANTKVISTADQLLDNLNQILR